jgi:AraC-like DNA-binding protein
MPQRSSTVIAFPPPVSSATREILTKALRAQIESLKRGELHVHIPRLHHLYESRQRMPYHFKPEIFLQLSGITEFSFPEEQVTLQPGSVCIVPRGMPHGEVARDERGKFENVVVSFYNGTIYVHVAHERAPGRPAVDNVHFFTTDLFEDLVLYLDRISELHHSDAKIHSEAIRALLIAEFSLLLGVMEARSQQHPSTTDVIALCKWQIHLRLHDSRLNLKFLAEELGCSSSYLSRLFHRKVGDRIVEHINRLRIQNAKDALTNTRLSAKVIAAGCGYRDAGYFGRVFRQATGRAPQQYRHDIKRIAASLESQPKTVYAQEKDHGAVPDLGEMNAIDALRLTKLSVRAIAAGCGYRDAKVFSRFFRQATGSSPQKYRREIQRAVSSSSGIQPPNANASSEHEVAAAFASLGAAKRSRSSA